MQTVEAEGFAPQGKRKEQDLSYSLLLNLAKRTEPVGEVVSAKCGAIFEGVNLKQAFVHLHHSAQNV